MSSSTTTTTTTTTTTLQRKNNIRAKLCTAIASLDPNASQEECAKSLHDIFQCYHHYHLPEGECVATFASNDIDGYCSGESIEVRQGNNNSNSNSNTATTNSKDDEESNITPLMLACDKSHTAAMIYLQTQILACKHSPSASTSAAAAAVSEAEAAEAEAVSEAASSSSISIEQLVEAWGHPTEASSSLEGGNSASHHAMMVNFVLGIDVLERFWGYCDESKEATTTATTTTKTRLQRFQSLVSHPNQNGDTPIMMACVSGHDNIIRHILERILKWTMKESSAETLNECFIVRVVEAWQSLQSTFATKNEELLSALNLACGYGHANIVQLLIQPHRLVVCLITTSIKLCSSLDGDRIDSCNNTECDDYVNGQVFELKPLLGVTYDDIKFCKSSLANIDAGLKRIKKQQITNTHLHEFEVQRKQIGECMVMLESELDRIAAETAMKILNDGSGPASKPVASSRTKKGKGKGKKKKGAKSMQTNLLAKIMPPADDVANGDERDVSTKVVQTKWSTKNEATTGDGTTPSPFITLQDGSIVSRMPQNDTIACAEGVNPPILKDEMPTKNIFSISTPKSSLQSILQFTNATQKSVTNGTESQSIEAKMESLCLDPSMLLLSSHGMAMEMSPCQLDAIESILEHQLNATKEARMIQDRLLANQEKQAKS